jgi:FG-GAP-like repeat
MEKPQSSDRRVGSRVKQVTRLARPVAVVCTGLLLTTHVFAGMKAQVQPPEKTPVGVITGASYHNDTSLPLRDLPQLPIAPREEREEREANENPKIPHRHLNTADIVVQSQPASEPNMPGTTLNFDGIPFPGVGCNCAPPDTNGEVGATQYVQIVNEGYQVFNKSTGASVLGPSGIATIWSGFGGVCQSNGSGDPVVMYDQLANRWVISQFAGVSVPTDECVAVSTTSDATGSWNRYAFHLGTNFFDYPHLAVWPDAYYMSMNVFNAMGTAFLGPQPFAFDRAKMLAGLPATFVSPGITVGPGEETSLPADLDGSTLPPPGAPATFVEWPGGSSGNTFRVFHFHADFTTPINTTFTLFANPAATGFTELCPSTRSCIPQSGTTSGLDGIGDRLMFRLAYRNFGDHESVVGNFTVSSGGVAGVRWFELRGVTAGPVTVFQESTYQPDTTWRWMASAAQDHQGNLALGFSASSAGINPQVRYAGRLVTDPINVLSQGEAHLFDGTGSQVGTGSRWGDYSDLTVDPMDDCTFWYTQEYYSTTGSFNWRTRIASFKFPGCTSTPTPLIATAGATLTNESCAPANGVIDPGERVTVTFNAQNIGNASTSNLVGTLLNTGGVTLASGPQAYGAMGAGATVGQPFSFTANGTCGGTLTATIHFQDGTTDFGNGIYTFTLGVQSPITAFSQSFDGVIAPALPASWTTAATGVEVPWVTSTANASSAPNDAFAPDPSYIGNTELVTPSIAVPAGGAKLTFKNLYNMESTFDGMVLEISINGGAFSDITTGGNPFISGGYNSTISSNYGSPIAGRSAWSGLSGGINTAPTYITSSINLPAAANGQNVRLKWRVATDNSVSASGAAGVRIDTITVDSVAFVCSTCSGSQPTVVTGTASGVGVTTATLNGTANPNGAATTANFEYGLTTGYGSTTPAQALGSGNAAAAIGGGNISGLACNTPYHFRAVASNSSGPASGSDVTFTTSACPPPTVVTGIATAIGLTGATLNGTANPNSAATTGNFEYGLTTGYGSTTPVQAMGSGNTAASIGGGTITGLACNTLYHFRAVATNTGGTTTGSDATFTTAACRRGDVNGDGMSDLLLRNGANGQNIGWLMNGLTVGISAFLPTIADTNWEVKGVGDFNGDGKADVIWRNKVSGQDIAWLMNGLTVANSAFLPTIADTNWEIAGVGDFDGDGKADVILRNRASGQNIAWLMNGLTVAVSAFLPTIADTNWEIVGVGDLNGDGKADVILRNKVTGQNIGWLMNSLTVVNAAFLPTIADTNWQIVGVGDVNGDRKADVLLRNAANGQDIGWLMDGLTVINSAFLPTIADTNWEIKALGDVDGDGKSDAIWRNKVSGQNIGWLMNGLTVVNSAFLPTIADTNWQIVAPR